MEPLKTLKEIQSEFEGKPLDVVFRAELRQEAIKEIKVMKGIFIRTKKDVDLIENIISKSEMSNSPALTAVVEYIKWKFNIKDGDLKST